MHREDPRVGLGFAAPRKFLRPVVVAREDPAGAERRVEVHEIGDALGEPREHVPKVSADEPAVRMGSGDPGHRGEGWGRIEPQDSRRQTIAIRSNIANPCIDFRPISMPDPDLLWERLDGGPGAARVGMDVVCIRLR